MYFNFNKWLDTMVYTETNKHNQQLLRLKSQEYITSLDPWKQFILFYYTLSSSQINKMLILGIKSDNTRFKNWVKGFIKSIKVNNLTDNIYAIPYLEFSDNYRYIIYKYIVELQIILLNAPVLSKPIYIYKTTYGIYPKLPTEIICTDKKLKCKPVPVIQYPFNSTTLDEEFDFSRFYDQKSYCCYYVIYIPEGNPILHISKHIHAFPYQDEVLLPFGSSFNVIHKELTQHRIKIGNKVNIQSKPFKIGPISMLDETSIKYNIVPIETYITIYSKPKGVSCVDMMLGTISCSSLSNINPNINPNIFMYNHDKMSYMTGSDDIIITDSNNIINNIINNNEIIIWDSKKIPKYKYKHLYVLVHSNDVNKLIKTKQYYMSHKLDVTVIGTIVEKDKKLYQVRIGDVIKYIYNKYHSDDSFNVMYVFDNISRGRV